MQKASCLSINLHSEMILIYPIYTVWDNFSVTKTLTAMKVVGRPTIGFPLAKDRKLCS